jgi:hypothetical protein
MPITVSVIVMAGLVAGIYALFAFVQEKFGAPDERTLPLREIAGLIQQLQAQHSAEAMVAIQGLTESRPRNRGAYPETIRRAGCLEHGHRSHTGLFSATTLA